jgi:succinyl-diaminopimelate desuccinylase
VVTFVLSISMKTTQRASNLAAVFNEIDCRVDDLVELTSKLIQFPTLNPPGAEYGPCAEFIGERLKKKGFAVETVRAHGCPGDSDQYPRINVIARYEAKQAGSCIHFNSHIDVVEVGSGWTVDPFAGLVRDGKVWGRGACDMKGGMAASIIAAECLIDMAPDLAGCIEISGTADEETGGFGGVAYLAEQGYFSPERVQHVIIPEPLQVDRVCLGHRGVWWAEIETLGRIAHGSMPFLGDCAMRHMGALIARMEEDLFPRLKEQKTQMPVVPAGAQESTLNINSVHAGQAEIDGTGLPAACVPDSARMVIDRRFLIEEELDEVKQQMRSILEQLRVERSDFKYKMRDLFEVKPVMIDRDEPVAKATAKAIADVLGRDAEFVCSPGTYDQKHIDRIGKLKNCIAYGPGVLELAHQPDEWVGIDDMINSAKVMAQTAYQLTSES